MELIECKTCGSHSFTGSKCDYCGNQYEDDKHNSKASDHEECETSLNNEPDFQETQAGKMLLKIMIYILVSIIWFAITVFIPPLFIITIILLVVYVIFRLTRRKK